MASLTVAFLCLFSSCVGSPSLSAGERELRPPQTGIRVGSLYYVREKPTDDISTPATLIKLCTTRLDRYRIKPDVNRVADIDLLDRLEVSAGLEGIKIEFAALGLSGSLSDYYTYSLRNVSRTDISKTDADRILNTRGVENDCANWRESMGKNANNWGVYQISGISVGDIRFARNSERAASADVRAKLGNLEPKLKAAIKKASGLSFSGKGLVVSFQPILRN